MGETASTRPTSEAALLAAYGEVSKSFHAIDDFRMKLLGLLPLASLIGLILLDAGQTLEGTTTATSKELIGFSAIFAAALTLALFSYEMRGIRRCHVLIREGQHLEELLGIDHGQFHVCSSEHDKPSTVARVSNSKFAACLIYSLVLAAWLFVALRFGFGVATYTCAAGAVLVGGIVATSTYALIRNWTAS